ncbi:unnamed protein product [Ectocarpus fasciculatus]
MLTRCTYFRARSVCQGTERFWLTTAVRGRTRKAAGPGLHPCRAQGGPGGGALFPR